MASMKLRVRSASGGPTIRVEIPLSCTLQGLKDVLAPLISLPAFGFSLSLNKKDEIEGPGSVHLSAFGVTSGDLLFYIVNSGRSSSPLQQLTWSSSSQVAGSTIPTESTGVGRSAVRSIDALEASSSRGGRAAAGTSSTRRELCAAAAARRAEAEGVSLAAEPERDIKSASLDSTSLDEQIVVSSDTTASPGARMSLSSSITSTAAEGVTVMGFETDETVAPEMLARGGGHRLVPIPDLLQRVLTTELENIRRPSMCLVLAVHAVMLETGFLRVETGSNHKANDRDGAGSSTLEGYELPSGWSDGGLVNITYTLPELARRGTSREFGQEALLRCQVVGNAVVVYGTVTGGSVHRVSLSVSKFLQDNLILQSHIYKLVADKASSSSAGRSSPDNESAVEDVQQAVGSKVLGEAGHLVATASMGNNIFRDIFELWKEVKDTLSLPLLTFLCEKTGLPPPPSLLRLPTELKIKVLDSLPSVALANLASACSEFRFLASNEELWKQKYKEDFGATGNRAPGGRGWKSAFVREFEHRKRREVERRQAERRAELVIPGDFFQLRPPSFSPHFGDFFQGLGGSTQHNFPGDVRTQRIASMGDTYGDLGGFGGRFPGADFDGRADVAWPHADNLPHANNLRSRGMRSGAGRLDGSNIGNGGGLAYPHYTAGRRDYGGVDPSI